MRSIFWLAILSLLLTSCQPQPPTTITILDGEQMYILETDERIPANLLEEARITFSPSDLLLVNGYPFPPDLALPPETDTLQIRRAVGVTLVTPGGEQGMTTAANTVGEALHQAGIQLYAADFIDPPADTSIVDGMRITYRPAQELTVTTSTGSVQIRSSAQTVGAALAGAGIPLIGLDYSLPAESDALPSDGQIRVVRVSEFDPVDPEIHPVRD